MGHSYFYDASLSVINNSVNYYVPAPSTTGNYYIKHFDVNGVLTLTLLLSHVSGTDSNGSNSLIYGSWVISYKELQSESNYAILDTITLSQEPSTASEGDTGTEGNLLSPTLVYAPRARGGSLNFW